MISKTHNDSKSYQFNNTLICTMRASKIEHQKSIFFFFFVKQLNDIELTSLLCNVWTVSDKQIRPWIKKKQLHSSKIDDFLIKP